MEGVYALFERCSQGPSFRVVQKNWFDKGSEDTNLVSGAETFGDEVFLEFFDGVPHFCFTSLNVTFGVYFRS